MRNILFGKHRVIHFSKTHRVVGMPSVRHHTAGAGAGVMHKPMAPHPRVLGQHAHGGSFRAVGESRSLRGGSFAAVGGSVKVPPLKKKKKAKYISF
jgi:hypothetical protein